MNTSNQLPLRASVRQTLSTYLTNLEGEQITNLYDKVLAEIEEPLLEAVMLHTQNNQTQAASLLGLNRGTLRKKLQQYKLL